MNFVKHQKQDSINIFPREKAQNSWNPVKKLFAQFQDAQRIFSKDKIATK